jgi:competence protein ComFC
MARSFYKPYAKVLAYLFYPQYCVGCSRRASDVLCRACFEALPFVGRPYYGMCGAPTTFEVFGCGECRDKDFAFDSARAPLRCEGVGEELVHTFKYVGYLQIVEKVIAPLLVGVLGSARFDAVVPVPLHRAACQARFQPGRAHGQRGSGEDRGAPFG